MRWFLDRGPKGLWWVIPMANRFMWMHFRKANYERPAESGDCGWKIDAEKLPKYVRGPIDLNKLRFEGWSEGDG